MVSAPLGNSVKLNIPGNDFLSRDSNSGKVQTAKEFDLFSWLQYGWLAQLVRWLFINLKSIPGRSAALIYADA